MPDPLGCVRRRSSAATALIKETVTPADEAFRALSAGTDTMSAVLLAAAAALLGLAVGSFLNVVIHRVPLRRPWSTPRSACPSCGHDPRRAGQHPRALLAPAARAVPHLQRADLSSLPLVELGTAALFGAAALRLGADWALPAFCLFFAALLAVALIDLDHFIVPNRIVFPMLAISVPLLAVAALLERDLWPLATGVAGALLASNCLLIINLISPRGWAWGT
jgi:leader peptidase (prepilin peptidase)/N-methyltransferase